MKADVWRELYRIITLLARDLPRGSRRMPDRLIVLVLFFAALHDRPVSWAVQRRHWPLWCRRRLPLLPSSTTMSRRLQTASVRAFIDHVLEHAQRDLPDSLYRMIDGKPLVIGNSSGDRQAGYGRAARGKAKGYKLHVLLHASSKIAAWRVAPMNVDERTMALRLVRDAAAPGYVLADANYDSNRLHGQTRAGGGQLITPRRRPGRTLGRGKQRHDPSRLRSMTLTEGPGAMGRELLHERGAIERWLGTLTSFAGGLGPLPAWVRTHRRVRRWVAAKLAINAVRISLNRRHRGG